MPEIVLKDWSDVIWFLIWLFIACVAYWVLLYCYEERAKDKEIRKMFLTETERNKRMMDSIEQDCSYDVSHEHYYGD
ncbi:MAG: hypothetical protein ABFD50_19065 [Smithella sp.]